MMLLSKANWGGFSQSWAGPEKFLDNALQAGLRNIAGMAALPVGLAGLGMTQEQAAQILRWPTSYSDEEVERARAMLPGGIPTGNTPITPQTPQQLAQWRMPTTPEKVPLCARVTCANVYDTGCIGQNWEIEQNNATRLQIATEQFNYDICAHDRATNLANGYPASSLPNCIAPRPVPPCPSFSPGATATSTIGGPEYQHYTPAPAGGGTGGSGGGTGGSGGGGTGGSGGSGGSGGTGGNTGKDIANGDKGSKANELPPKKETPAPDTNLLGKLDNKTLLLIGAGLVAVMMMKGR